MKMNRKIVQVIKPGTHIKESPVDMTKAEALSFVWELTKEVYSFTKGFDAESRLQRHVVTLARQQG